jgi:hypothetical protein
MRELICGQCRSPEEQERRLRQIFGLAPAETANTNRAAGGMASVEERG